MQNEVLPALRVAHAQVPTDPETRWKTVIPIVKDLKAKARKLGLWNLFLSKKHYPKFGVDLTNLEVCLEHTMLVLMLIKVSVCCNGGSAWAGRSVWF